MKIKYLMFNLQCTQWMLFHKRIVRINRAVARFSERGVHN